MARDAGWEAGGIRARTVRRRAVPSHRDVRRSELQRTGLGTALLQRVHHEVASAGAADVELFTLRDVPAHAFYLKQGYIVNGVGRGEGTVSMFRHLGAR